MADQELDRSHAATPYKLEKARERGQVSKSSDVVSAAVFIAAVVFLTWQGWPTWRAQFRLDQAVLVQAAHAGESAAMLWPLVERLLRETLLQSIPFFATLLLSGVLANVLQSGWVLSLEPIKADWKRLDPAAGLKRLLSLRTLFHGVRAVLKLLLLCGVAWLALEALTPQFHALAALSPVGAARTLLADIASLGLELALVLGLIALLDLVYTRREFAKQMRMSRRELRDEIKHREGDPRIRARMRELRRELLKRSTGLRRTRDADVLVTNPTHYAVALRYVHGEMEAPRLVAKGSGVLAAAMRGIASRHRVPIVQNPTLARTLFHELPVDAHVPPALYAQVARIIVWVFAMREARAGRARPGAARSPRPAGPAAPSGRLA